MAGKITRAQVREIAEKKMKDLNANDVEAARDDRGLGALDGPAGGGVTDDGKHGKRLEAA